MQRLVNNPTYTVNHSYNEPYKASVMMLMDCECRPFETVTRLTNLNDLNSNYNTENDNISYRIAKNLLNTNKVNIIGVNPVTNDNIRTTLAVYNYDDRIIKIHPSYNILSSTTNKIEDNRKKYKIYLDRNDLKKNIYFKIYQSKNKSYLFTIINSDRIKDYDKYLFNRIFDSKKVEESIVVCKNNCTFLMWRYLCLNGIEIANNEILLKGWKDKDSKKFNTSWRNWYTDSEWINTMKNYIKNNPLKEILNYETDQGTINNSRQLIKRLFDIDWNQYTIPLIIGINDNTSVEDLKFQIAQKLIDNDIDYNIDLNTEYSIKLYAEYINEKILTNCESSFDIDKLPKIRTSNITLDDYNNEWYSYRLKIVDKEQNFYFKTYYTKQNSLLFCVVNLDTLGYNDRQMITTSVANRDSVIAKLFSIDKNYYTKMVLITVTNTTTEIEYENILKKTLLENGILSDYECYHNEFGEYTRYLTLYTNKIHKTIMTNLYQDIDKRKSYDIDYLSNYNRMIFSAWSKLSTTISNIYFTISRANDSYTIQIYNKKDTDIVDSESYTNTNLNNLIESVNNNSKYLEMQIYSDYLQPGTYELSIDNTNTNVYDSSLFESINKLNKDNLFQLGVDIIYNTRNSIDYLNRFSKIVNECDNRILLLSDNIESEKEVDRYDLTNIVCSDDILSNLEDNLLKDDKTYKRSYIVYDDCILTYNNHVVPDKYLTYNLINIEPDNILKPYIKFSKLIEKFKNAYDSFKRKKLYEEILYIINNFEYQVTVDGVIEHHKISEKYSVDTTNTKIDTGTIYITDIVRNYNYKINNYLEFIALMSNIGVTDLSLSKWNESIELIPIVKVLKYCAEDIDESYDNVLLLRRSEFNGFDTSYRLLYNIFTKNDYEFDIEDRLNINYLDNEEKFIDKLENIYNSDIHSKNILFNNLVDNEYYYSLLNPNVTFNKYRVSVEDYLPTILQINHILSNMERYCTDLNEQSDCENIVDKSIEDISNIVNVTNALKLKSFNKVGRKVSVVFGVQFSNSIKLTYDFEITINT